MSKDSRRQPFMEHVQELRSRSTWSVVALLGGTSIGYALRDQLLDILVAPLGETIYYTSPGGGFSFMIQLCLGFGVIVAVPVLIFHLIRFLAPVLPNYSLRFLVSTLISSCLLVALGVAFAYFVSLPAALYFLSEFSNDQVQSLISTDTYMSFVTLYLAGFAALFQLPLILLILNGMTPLTPSKLLAGTKWVVLGSFVAAALITPTPDPFNQTIMAGPVIFLYLGSIIPIKVVNRNRLTTTVDDAEENESERLDPLFNLQAEPAVDFSQFRMVKRTARSYRGRNGYLCYWKQREGHSADVVVTFQYKNQHRFLKRYTAKT